VPSDLHERFGQIRANSALDKAGCPDCDRAASASHVQHRMVRLQLPASQQGVADGQELTVVAVGTIDVVHGLTTVPCLELLLIRAQCNPLGERRTSAHPIMASTAESRPSRRSRAGGGGRRQGVAGAQNAAAQVYRLAPAMKVETMYVACRSRETRARS
jgi:hypothetical protein